MLAESLRVAGGLSVGMNFLNAVAEVGDAHHFFVTVPDNPGYEVICRDFRHGTVVSFPRNAGLLRRLWWEQIRIPGLLRKFAPAVILSLCNRPVRSPPCPQALFLQNAHRLYPLRCAGNIGLLARVMRLLRTAYFRVGLRHVDMMLFQTETMRRRWR